MSGIRSWRGVRLTLRDDRARLSAWLAKGGLPFSRFHPGYIAVFLFRVSQFLYANNHKHLARALWMFNSLVTGSDLPPGIDIGPGFLLPVPCGISVACKAGRNLTVMMCSGIGSGVGRYDDIGAGPGLPILGDDVLLEPHTAVLGPYRIGDRVIVKAGAVVVDDVPSGSHAVTPSPRFLAVSGAGR